MVLGDDAGAWAMVWAMAPDWAGGPLELLETVALLRAGEAASDPTAAAPVG